MDDSHHSVSDEEFYQKLMQLREEQKQTMKQLESLYAQKFELDGQYEPTGSSEKLEHLAAENMKISDSKLAELEARYRDLSLDDMILDQENRQYEKEPEISVDKMWDGVAMTEYMEMLDREHHENLEEIQSNLEKHREQAKLRNEAWKPSITVPEPFSMTIREYEKPKKKSRSLQIFEMEQEKKRLAEMQELNKKFKANPVPGHTFLPLYQEMQENQKAIRNNVKELRKSELKRMEQPFKFAERDKDYARISKLSRSLDNIISEEKERPPKFKAKPVPKKILEKPSVFEKLQEEEMYRQIRCKIRAQALLKQSKAPVSSGDSANSTRTAREIKSATIADPYQKKSRPKPSHDVPDFDYKYKKFLADVAKNKTMKESTVCKPFVMRTEQKHLARTDTCVKADLDKRSRPATASSFVSPTTSGGTPRRKTRVIRSDTIPPKITKSFELMASKNKEKLEESMRDGKMTEEKRQKKARENSLRRHIATKVAANDHRLLLEETRARKLQEFREQQRELEQEYQRKLAEMSNRLETRQLLFERQSEINAKKEAEKRYLQTLRNAGVDDELLTSINSAAGSSYDLKLDDFNDSFADVENSYSYESDFNESEEKAAAEH